MPKRLAIIGIGPNSTTFTAKLCQEIVDGPAGHGVVAVGVYDNSKTFASNTAIRQIDGMRLKNISVSPSPSPESNDRTREDLTKLIRRVEEHAPESLFWIVDANPKLISACKRNFEMLKTRRPFLSITGMCFTDSSPASQQAFDIMDTITPVLFGITNNSLVGMTLVVNTASSLSSAVGDIYQMDMLAKSVAGLVFADLHNEYNSAFEKQLEKFGEQRRKYIGLALGSRGIVTQNAGVNSPLRLLPQVITPEQVRDCVNHAVNDLLQNLPHAMTTLRPLDLNTVNGLPLLVNVISPLPDKGDKYRQAYSLVQQELKKPMQMPIQMQMMQQPPINNVLYTMVRNQLDLKSLINGKGIDLSRFDDFKTLAGDFCCQVCILYSVEKQAIFVP